MDRVLLPAAIEVRRDSGRRARRPYPPRAGGTPHRARSTGRTASVAPPSIGGGPTTRRVRRGRKGRPRLVRRYARRRARARSVSTDSARQRLLAAAWPQHALRKTCADRALPGASAGACARQRPRLPAEGDRASEPASARGQAGTEPTVTAIRSPKRKEPLTRLSFVPVRQVRLSSARPSPPVRRRSTRGRSAAWCASCRRSRR